MTQTSRQLTFSVPGMSCGHCRAAIDEAGYDVAEPRPQRHTPGTRP